MTSISTNYRIPPFKTHFTLSFVSSSGKPLQCELFLRGCSMQLLPLICVIICYTSACTLSNTSSTALERAIREGSLVRFPLTIISNNTVAVVAESLIEVVRVTRNLTFTNRHSVVKTRLCEVATMFN